jgi:hypothetical protein
MALYTPKKVVLNWYQYDASFSIELMTSFVDGIEKQATESVASYNASRHTADGHQGLDRESWDLENIFGEYFPSLQRRSAFLTAWSYLEHQLDRVCLFYQSERKFGLSFMDLSGQQLFRCPHCFISRVPPLSRLLKPLHLCWKNWGGGR